MQVLGIGNVIECNRSYIHLNNEGKEDRIRSTPEILSAIRDTASMNYAFYRRMAEEIRTVYTKRSTEVKKRYYFITDEMVKEAFLRDHSEGLSLSWSKDLNNEIFIREYGKLAGLQEGAEFASNRSCEAHKLLVQAENSLKIR